MRIENITAGFDSCYNPSKANNGCGYWQPYGDCTVTLDDGTVLGASYNDTSCGDFGERWMLVFSYEGEKYTFCEDFVGTDEEYQRDLYDANNATWHRMEARFGIDANELIHEVRCAIDDAAWAERLRRRDE